MANEIDVGGIVMRIRADMSGVKAGVDTLTQEMRRMQGSTDQAGAGVEASSQKMSKSVQDSSLTQAAAYAAIAAVATKAFAIVIGAIEAGVKASERYKAAIIGLESVATGRGIGEDALNAALAQVTDGFLDASSASTAFKNLLTRGYSLDQATNTIIRLKDAATFGRQAALGLAEAVVTASEGIKQQNSVLVDNSGVTKNIAKMHEDYAKAIGVTTASLTLQQQIEAEYQGIMEETQHQMGDLAKAADTLSGKQAEAAQSSLLLTQAYGQSMTPAVSVVTDALKGLTDMLTGVVKEMPGLVSGVTAGGLAIAGMTIATKAAQALKAFNLNLQAAAGGATIFGASLKTAMPILFAVAAAIGLVTAAVTAMAKAKEAAAEKAEKEAAAELERIQTLQTEADALKALYTRYEELSRKQYRTLQESQELGQLQNTLQTQYGLSADALDGLAGSYTSTADAARGLYIEQLRLLQADKDIAATNARLAYEEAQQRVRDVEEYGKVTASITEVKQAMQDLYAKQPASVGWTHFLQGEGWKLNAQLNELEATKKLLEGRIDLDNMGQYGDARGSAAVTFIRAQMAAIAGEVEIGGAEVSERVKSVLDDAFMNYAKGRQNDPAFDADALLASYADALSSADIAPALKAMDELNTKILSGGQIAADELPALQQHWATLMDFASEATKGMGGDVATFESILISLAPAIAPVLYQTEALGDAITMLQSAVREAKIGELIGNDAAEAQVAYESIKKDVEDLTSSMRKTGSAYEQENNVIRALGNIRASFSETSTVTKEALQASVDALEQYGIAVPRTYDEAQAAIQSHGALQAALAYDVREAYTEMANQVNMYRTVLARMEADPQSDPAGIARMKALIADLEISVASLTQSMTKVTNFNIGAKIDEMLSDDLTKSKEAYEAARQSAEDLASQMRKIGAAYEQENSIILALGNIRASFSETSAVTKESVQASIDALRMYGIAVPQTYEEAQAAIQMHATLQEALAYDVREAYTAMAGQVNIYREALAKLEADPQSDPAGIARMKALIADLEIAVDSLSDSMTRVTNFNVEVKADVEATGAEQLLKTINDLESNAKSAQGAIENIRVRREQIADARRMVTETQRLQKAGKEVSDEWRNNVSQALGADFSGSLEEAATSLDIFDLSLQGMVDKIASDLDTAERQIMDLINGVITGTIDISVDGKTDMSGFLAAANAALAIINAVRSFFGKSPLTVPSAAKSSGRSGGGGSRTDPAEEARREAEQAAEEAERAAEEAERDAEQRRRDAVRADLRMIEHKKTMNQITVQQEIAMLEQIKSAHQLTADELMDIEEQLYEARESLRNDSMAWDLALLDHQVALGQINEAEEIARLNRIKNAHELTTQERYAIEERLYNLQTQIQANHENTVKGVYKRLVDALKERLNEEKELELDALDDRINALNALTKAENEAARKEDYARSLADVQRELAVTKSARRRRELEEELAEMEADETRRLAQERRQAEIDALNDQKQAVNDKYAKLAEEENLRQEALRLVMSNNLQTMSDLIASYSGQWQEAGEQLAKALMNGITGNSSGILGTLTRLEAGIQENINFQLRNIGSSLPMSSGGVSVIINGGFSVREEADVDSIARAIHRKIQEAGR